jgi:hypothetical protein
MGGGEGVGVRTGHIPDILNQAFLTVWSGDGSGCAYLDCAPKRRN